MKRVLLLGLLLALASCQTTDQIGERGPAPPLPDHGPIAYSCADGTQLVVTFEPGQAQVAVVGGYSMALPNIGSPDAPHYSNGRYGLAGRGASTSWEVGRRAPVTCHGS